MTRENRVPIGSLIDFYQCIPDYEDVMHLPSHELDEMLSNLRYMQKSYLDGRTSPLFTTYLRGDDGYRREDYMDFLLPNRDTCSRQCPYNSSAHCSSSKFDNKLKSTFEGSSFGREYTSTPFPKGSITTGSTLSNKSSKTAISSGYSDIALSKPNRARRKRNTSVKTERRSWSKPTTSYLDSSLQYQGGSPSFQKEYDCDEIYGGSWMEGDAPKVQRSLPCSPVHRRSTKNVNTEKQRRSRLLSYLSTPDIRVPEEKSNHVFRAQPFPRRIFSNYLNKRREDKLNSQVDSRKTRAEELLRTSFLPPSMRRRQKVNTSAIRSEQPKTDEESESRHRHDTSSDRFRYKGPSPYRKVERQFSSHKRRSRPTSVEARDNLASLLRLQASRLKLEAESQAAAEAAAANAVKKMRARATRLSPVWHSALSRPTTAEDLMLKAARRREEAAERNRRRRRAIAAMRERVRAAPSLMERQSLINRTASTSGVPGFSNRYGALKTSKRTDRQRRPTAADVWKCYSNYHNDYIRSPTQLSSHPPKKRRSRVVISNKNYFSDDEVQRQYRCNSKQRQKFRSSQQKELREVYYDPHENDYSLHYRKQRSRPGSPTKPRSSVNHSPNQQSPENGHSDDYSEEEQLLPPSRHSTSCNVNAGGRNSRADWSFSDSHGDDPQIPQEQYHNGSSDQRNGQTYSTPEHKRTEYSDEASVSRDEFGIRSRRQYSPFLKAETWPKDSTKGKEHCNRSHSLDQYDHGPIEAVTKQFEDISLKCSSPTHERVMETNFEGSTKNEQSWLNNYRSVQSSPEIRRRALYHDYKTIHDSIPGLDLALQKEYYNEGNLRYNIRSPKRHLIQSKSSDTYIPQAT